MSIERGSKKEKHPQDPIECSCFYGRTSRGYCPKCDTWDIASRITIWVNHKVVLYVYKIKRSQSRGKDGKYLYTFLQHDKSSYQGRGKPTLKKVRAANLDDLEAQLNVWNSKYVSRQ
jgi:hypothetical protein